MTKVDGDVCSGGPGLIFACSGAADVGAVADRAARRMTKAGFGQMFCLAGVGGAVQPILGKTQSAAAILAIDGCGMSCAAETLRRAGIGRFEHLVVTELGLEKGQTDINDANIDAVAARGRDILA